MKFLAIALLLFARSASANDPDVRVEVFAFSDSDPGLASEAERALKADIEAIKGAIAVSKQPDVIISLYVMPVKIGESEFLMMAFEANATVPNNIASASLHGEASAAGVHNTQVLLDSLSLIGVPFAVIGPRQDLQRLCAEIASSVERSTISSFRQHPTDPDPGTSMENFMLRMGAKKVIPSPRQ